LKEMTALDYVVVFCYLVGIAAFGSSFYRRKSTANEYFLGGRSMPWLSVGISIVAADLSAISVMGLPAWGYKHNLELLWIAVGYPLVAPVVILVFVPFYVKLNLYTAYEYLERRFSLSVRLIASFLFQILRGTHVAIALYAPSLIINFVTGLPVWQCILLMGLFTTIYTSLGGMKAVIWTDVIQFCMVMSSILLVFCTAIGHVKGGIIAAYYAAMQAGRLRLFNFSTDPTELTSFWACIIGGSLLSLAPLATDQAILQRLFTTRSVKECTQSVILQSVLVTPINLLLYLAGTALFSFYHFHPAHLAGLNTSDAIMPFFAVRELPSGVSGLIVASIFAASMAVMSAGINALTTATTVDYYQRLFRPHETPQHYASIGRVGTLCWGLAATLFATSAKDFGELAIGYTKVSSFISGPLLGIFLLGTLTKRTTAGGTLIGMGIGIAAVCLVTFHSRWCLLHIRAIGAATTIFAGYLASLFMATPSSEKTRGYVVGYGEVVSSERNRTGQAPI